MAELDLKARRKPTLKITFADDRVINVLPPKKHLYDALDELEKMLVEAGGNEDELDSLYRVLADILSNNSEGTTITDAYLAQALDLDDLSDIIYAYIAYTQEIAQAKNLRSPYPQMETNPQESTGPQRIA